MTSFKGYANDVENGRVNVESKHSFVKIGLNKFLRSKNQMLNAWKNYFLNECVDWTLTLSTH